MARPLRIEFPGAWYHVMNRGLGKRAIFERDSDYHAFFNLLGDISQLFKIQIHAYSLMDNHYHLLVHTPSEGLGRAMRHLNGIYTQGWNKRHKTDGPLFRGRYKALLVDSEEYLTELVRYIHLNPVKAGICTHPKNHVWTSHKAYLLANGEPSWLVTGEVLQRFSKNISKAKRKLDEFVLSGVPREMEVLLEKERGVLGSEGFKDWVKMNWLKESSLKSREVTKKDKSITTKVKPLVVLQMIAFAYDVKIENLRKSVRGQDNRARTMAAYLLRQLIGMSQKETAKWINAPSEYTVATMQKRFRGKISRDVKLKKKLNVIIQRIMNQVKT